MKTITTTIPLIICFIFGWLRINSRVYLLCILITFHCLNVGVNYVCIFEQVCKTRLRRWRRVRNCYKIISNFFRQGLRCCWLAQKSWKRGRITAVERIWTWGRPTYWIIIQDRLVPKFLNHSLSSSQKYKLKSEKVKSYYEKIKNVFIKNNIGMFDIFGFNAFL